MKIVNIYYIRYFTSDGSLLNVGGVETYITNLSILCKDLGYDVRIYQYADFPFEKKLDYADVYGVTRKSSRLFQDLYNMACEKCSMEDRVVNIIANDTLIPKWRVPHSIVIQHGIGFDISCEKKEPLFINFLKKARKAYGIISRLENVDDIVCVDNNFICWYRTQTTFRRINLIPILNFAAIGPKVVNRNNEKVRIVFARRFVKIRGTRLFAPVAKRLLDEFPNIEITFAGGGPDENYIKSVIGSNNRANYTSYSSQDSIEFHQQFDIAVVPTLYSEGTSLSLLEAMSAHCAVVCTNIGGMTNIVLDEYNGLMVSPDSDEIYNAIKRLVEDSNLRKEISDKAYETVCKSFSLEKWQKGWMRVLTKKFNSIN